MDYDFNDFGCFMEQRKQRARQIAEAVDPGNPDAVERQAREFAEEVWRAKKKDTLAGFKREMESRGVAVDVTPLLGDKPEDDPNFREMVERCRADITEALRSLGTNNQ